MVRYEQAGNAGKGEKMIRRYKYSTLPPSLAAEVLNMAAVVEQMVRSAIYPLNLNHSHDIPTVGYLIQDGKLVGVEIIPTLSFDVDGSLTNLVRRTLFCLHEIMQGWEDV